MGQREISREIGKQMQLVIPMSGMGKRFLEKGYKVPKPLIKVSGRPIIEHIIEMYPGITNILFIVNKIHFEDDSLDLPSYLNRIAPNSVVHTIQPHDLGPAWAIKQSEKFISLDKPVVVNYCYFSCIWNF